MNYFIYDNTKFLYIDIYQYNITKNNISIEIILSSKEETYNVWNLLKQNLNLTFYLQNNYNSFSFVLKECYTNNNILILKGEIP